jgi:predicted enzyme related to lactoylglutathione lyase
MLPPVGPHEIVFFERYRSADAFLAHVSGPVFTSFVAAHGEDFTGSGGKPFTTVEFLDLHAGFVRGAQTQATGPGVNRHPGVMFEIIARDQAMIQHFYTAVFGWQYQTGTGGFSYIHFPAGVPPLLGGIGQAEANTPGFAPGHNFYLLVDDLAPVIARAVAAGGQKLMPPTAIDGYHFAMITDPEGNPVGLVEPFSP